MKKILFAALLSCLPLPLLAQPAERPTKLYASSAEVQTLVAQAKAEDKSGLLVTNVEGYAFVMEHRNATTPPTVHPGHAELIEVLEGSCTLITGGKLVGAKPLTAGSITQGGTAIEGGTARKIAKGDYIMVPANTPHQYTEVNGLIMMTLHMPVAGK
jgi:quercetin dioxygenase-like cupin family protein